MSFSKSQLYQKIISDENIFSAIYSLESYVFERKLLDTNSIKLFNKLKDIYDDKEIKKTILKCRSKLENILTTDKLFDVQVYLKAKKYVDNQMVECRPLHTSDLITQICMVSLLNIIMFDEHKTNGRQLSGLSQLLPKNFYGNLPSTMYEKVFHDWKVKYKEYTEQIMTTYEDAKNTYAYKYEVLLDLQNFFPSIHPDFIYKFILSKTKSIYTGSDLKCFEIILHKLLYFNITNLPIAVYNDRYCKDGQNEGREYLLNRGIPQGLPQAYFFGNLAMLPISKEFDKMFPGKSFYYVDDSVIYTNSENASIGKFQESLKKLNNNINKTIKNITYDDSHLYRINLQVYKSSSAPIHSLVKMSKSFLVGMGLEASRVSFDIYNTLNEHQDVSLLDKISELSNALDNEISGVKSYLQKNKNKTKCEENGEKDSFEVYLQSLTRYKKFFKYRQRLLEIRQVNDIAGMQNEFNEKYLNNKLNSSEDFEMFFKHFDEDIFFPEASLIIDNVLNEKDKKDFIKKLRTLESKLLSTLPDSILYFTKNFKEYKQYTTNYYSTLVMKASNTTGNYSKKKESLVIQGLNISLDPSQCIWLGYGKTYDKIVFKFSNTYKRRILNAYISSVINVETSNSLEFIKLDKRPLKYYELRILMYIRNHYADIGKFKVFLDDIISNLKTSNYEKVDFSLVEILDIFKTYVREPEKIDKLIIIHKYVSSIWRNGSRFLYFYTLHNQEHSVELMKSTVNICKMIDFLQLKQLDYYLLFLACYLHDVSMVLQPPLATFLVQNDKTNIVYTSFLTYRDQVREELEISNDNDAQYVKKLMIDAFEKVNAFYESISRDDHVVSSANFINTSKDLGFIETTMRNIVSSVAIAHGYNANDVYGLKSNAKNDKISEKNMMILLRIADLLDISKDRVSLNILEQNIVNMPLNSQYHWITHSAIDKFELRTSYKFNKPSITNGNKFTTGLLRENFVEDIILEIFLNASNLTTVKTLKCKNANAEMNITDNSSIISIKLGRDNNKDTQCSEKNCTFLCKWMCHKNKYLLPELNALKQYIDRIPNLTFTTKIRVLLNFTDSQPLQHHYFDIVHKQIDSSET